MILILGSSTYEQGTDPVIDWLIHYRVKFLKISLDDMFMNNNELKVEVNNKCLIFNGINLNTEVDVIWYRHFLESFNPVVENTNPHNSRINTEVYNEIRCFMDLLQYYLKDKKWVSNMNSIYLNKLTVLNVAMENGLKVPYSEIISTKEDLISMFNKINSGKVILKPFSDRNKSYYTINNHSYLSFVKGFNLQDIENFSDFFFPSLFQEKIEIDFEIRVYYIGGKFFSSAILIKPENEYDDRKKIIEQNKINIVRYELPNSIKDSLVKLMNSLDLKIGAIDLIYNSDNEYCFLEVNPIGQYSYESEKNNFYIEKNIAEYLIKLINIKDDRQKYN